MPASLLQIAQSLRHGVLSVRRAPSLVEVLGGRLDPERLTLVSVWRNEIFFAPAFLAHYRALGVEQFLVLDDGSTDGTREFLLAQPDCVVLRSDLGFADPVVMRDPAGRIAKRRAGTYFKIALPQAFLSGRCALYADADEFLLLPPGVLGLDAVLARMTAGGHRAVLASVVEFYPRHLADLDGAGPVRALEDLLAQCPYHDQTRLLDLGPDGRFAKIAPSASRRLFERFALRPPPGGMRNSPRHKTPILVHGQGAFRTGSHDASVPVAGDMLLCLAHFVFTARWKAKIDAALARRAHADGAAKYGLYAALHAELSAPGAPGFMGDASVRFGGPKALQAAGLMRW